MMKQTNINFRIDETVKEQMNRICDELGITLTAAFNMFAKAMVREHGIPFDLKLDIPNADTIAALEEGDRMLIDPKAMRFSSVDDLLAELNT